MMSRKPTIAVHKFSSCDGCQLALLNMGEALVTLAERVDIKHFAEAGVLDEMAEVDIAFIEGSVVTQHDTQRIQQIRKNSRYLITMGACATSGGIQALKNLSDSANSWTGAIYPQPEFIDSLDRSEPIKSHVKVDFEIWGCPINSGQISTAISLMLEGVMPQDEREKLCIECKREGLVCTLVTAGEPCMGPVTRTGCGALCPQYGRACYGCYGDAELPHNSALARRFSGLGLLPDQVHKRFQLIHPDQAKSNDLVKVESGKGGQNG
ncbi:MAG: sulfhydrogenase subunit delta [Neptuniibacter sp.]|nr:sulfhydrogenase subunit delta [Neptuniibacter sp.]